MCLCSLLFICYKLNNIWNLQINDVPLYHIKKRNKKKYIYGTNY